MLAPLCGICHIRPARRSTGACLACDLFKDRHGRERTVEEVQVTVERRARIIERNRQIVQERAGGLTLTELARSHGISVTRVKQILGTTPKDQRYPVDVSDAIDEIAAILHGDSLQALATSKHCPDVGKIAEVAG